ncbi:MAG: hypothetical protein I4E98_21880 [Planktothrix agardhii KL2]|jgi:hypothetical protein|uniref:hypothetical protein n=1 Tax=Planktothrix agardhii TaxID=1160 RepID=UPI001A30ACB4|nr:hypothetical protein [Planktothrix agardhii]MBG0749199.1 hypothetical protein [Planktothrix agardhii KL2]MDS1348534.1 hypothetical protein [Planktothrix agardhii NRERC-751]CAD5983321.1 hypothetical protein NO2A_04341 [Planktothrix agardhii]
MEKLLKSLKLCGKFLLAKSKWLHPLLPDKFKADLPLNWNFNMAWKYIKSGETNFIQIFCFGTRSSSMLNSR